MHQIIKADPTEPDIPMIPFGEIKIPGRGFSFVFRKLSCLFFFDKDQKLLKINPDLSQSLFLLWVLYHHTVSKFSQIWQHFWNYFLTKCLNSLYFSHFQPLFRKFSNKSRVFLELNFFPKFDDIECINFTAIVKFTIVPILDMTIV